MPAGRGGLRGRVPDRASAAHVADPFASLPAGGRRVTRLQVGGVAAGDGSGPVAGRGRRDLRCHLGWPWRCLSSKRHSHCCASALESPGEGVAGRLNGPAYQQRRVEPNRLRASFIAALNDLRGMSGSFRESWWDCLRDGRIHCVAPTWRDFVTMRIREFPTRPHRVRGRTTGDGRRFPRSRSACDARSATGLLHGESPDAPAASARESASRRLPCSEP